VAAVLIYIFSEVWISEQQKGPCWYDQRN